MRFQCATNSTKADPKPAFFIGSRVRAGGPAPRIGRGTVGETKHQRLGNEGVDRLALSARGQRPITKSVPAWHFGAGTSVPRDVARHHTLRVITLSTENEVRTLTKNKLKGTRCTSPNETEKGARTDTHVCMCVMNYAVWRNVVSLHVVVVCCITLRSSSCLAARAPSSTASHRRVQHHLRCNRWHSFSTKQLPKKTPAACRWHSIAMS